MISPKDNDIVRRHSDGTVHKGLQIEDKQKRPWVKVLRLGEPPTL
jgi:hypothetical protein